MPITILLPPHPSSPPLPPGSRVKHTLHVPTPAIHAQHSTLFTALTHAHNTRLPLVIRPDDVWLALISQLSRCLSNPGEEVAVEAGMEAVLKGFMTPSFSTTTRSDKATALALLTPKGNKTSRSTQPPPLHRHGHIPSITLLGTTPDWLNLTSRLSFFASLLTPGSVGAQKIETVRELVEVAFVEVLEGRNRGWVWERFCVFEELRYDGRGYQVGWVGQMRIFEGGVRPWGELEGGWGYPSGEEFLEVGWEDGEEEEIDDEEEEDETGSVCSDLSRLGCANDDGEEDESEDGDNDEDEDAEYEILGYVDPYEESPSWEEVEENWWLIWFSYRGR